MAQFPVFGLMVMTGGSYRELIKHTADKSIEMCVLVAKARGAAVGTEYGRGRDEAAADIAALLDNPDHVSVLKRNETPYPCP